MTLFSPSTLNSVQEQASIWVTGMIGAMLTSIAGWLVWNAKLLIRAIKAWVIDKESQTQQRDTYFIDNAYTTGAEVAAEAVAKGELSIQAAVQQIVDYVNKSIPGILAKMEMTPDVIRDKASAKLYVAMRTRAENGVSK